MMPSRREVQEYLSAINRAAEIAAQVGISWESFELDCEVAFDLATEKEAAETAAGLVPVGPA